jgi:hypothetical protein
MAITQTIRLEEEDVFNAIQWYLKKQGIEVHNEAKLIFPGQIEADMGDKYIEVEI